MDERASISPALVVTSIDEASFRQANRGAVKSNDYTDKRAFKIRYSLFSWNGDSSQQCRQPVKSSKSYFRKLCADFLWIPCQA